MQSDGGHGGAEHEELQPGWLPAGGSDDQQRAGSAAGPLTHSRRSCQVRNNALVFYELNNIQ